jgi:phage gp29-like protein
MPRAKAKAKPRAALSRKKDQTVARALASREPTGSLERNYFAGRVPRRQNQRSYFGKTLDLDRIEIGIRNAALGHMVQITDIGREGLQMDGHLSGLVQKRFNRATLFDYEIVANDGGGREDFDHTRARKRADFVRRQLARIPEFALRLMDLNWGVWDNRAAQEISWLVEPGDALGDGSIALGWRAANLSWIHARRLSYNQSRDVIVIDQDEGSDFKNPLAFRLDDIPDKFIPYTPRLFSDYNEREGLILRSLYWSYFQRLGTRLRLTLTEVFGAPWRLAYWDPPPGSPIPVNNEALVSAFNVLQNMSGQSAGWLPPGVKGQFFQPAPGSGQTHKDLIEDARFVLSKLIVGGTGTTDAVSTGLGSSIGDAHMTEEDMIIATDLYRLAATVEDRLTDVIIMLNYGVEELDYAPKFQFRIAALRDRQKEIANIGAALGIGMQIAVEEAYEMAGYRVPRKDEPVLSMVLPTADAGMPAPTPRAMIIYPPGKSPPPGETRVEPLEALPGLDQFQPPPVRELPPAPVELEPPPVAPSEEVEARDDDPDDDDDRPRPAYASPSGLSDLDDDDEPAIAPPAAPVAKRKPTKRRK